MNIKLHMDTCRQKVSWSRIHRLAPRCHSFGHPPIAGPRAMHWPPWASEGPVSGLRARRPTSGPSRAWSWCGGATSTRRLTLGLSSSGRQACRRTYTGPSRSSPLHCPRACWTCMPPRRSQRSPTIPSSLYWLRCSRSASLGMRRSDLPPTSGCRTTFGRPGPCDRHLRVSWPCHFVASVLLLVRSFACHVAARLCCLGSRGLGASGSKPGKSLGSVNSDALQGIHW
mmetsp:Transcript_62411/g.158693  ORF Transcript_62411/g.158693 Transcript_62411/m.158693 type:complete len:227 (-) Transcript_62411:90-770(-)